MNISQSQLNRSESNDVAVGCGTADDCGMGEPKLTSKSEPVLLLTGAGAATVVPCCWDDGGGVGNFDIGRTLVPAAGGGGSRTDAPDDATVPRDRSLDDVATGTSDPSADFFA